MTRAHSPFYKIAEGGNHFLGMDATNFQIFRRAVMRDVPVSAFPQTDEGYYKARAVFDAIEPIAETFVEPRGPYRIRRISGWGVGSVVGAVLVLSLVGTAAVFKASPQTGDSAGAAAVASPSETPAALAPTREGRIVVAAATQDGSPLPGAEITITGTQSKEITDRSGQARLSLLDVGVYQVLARKAGFYNASTQLVITEGSPSPLQLKLTFLPPMGSFVSAAVGRQMDVLQIASLSPFQAVRYRYSWGCIDQTWSPDLGTKVEVDAHNNTLASPWGTVFAIVTGPEQLDSRWSKGEPPAGVPVGADQC